MIKDKLNRIKEKKGKLGFTLAEVLITLVIIGVVTALTIPSLLASINDKTYDAKRQGFATRMAQAVSQIGILNAYEPQGDIDTKEETASMNFIVEALQKTYSIAQVCELENYKACDFPGYTTTIWGEQGPNILTASTWSQSAQTGLDATKLGGLDPKGALFRTKNGESVLLYYNPRCIAEQVIDPDTIVDPALGSGTKNFAKEVCINMVYDLDGGKKGPNKLGKDMGFAIVLYPDTPYFVMTKGVAHYTYAGSGTSTFTSKAADNACNSTSLYSYKVGQLELPSREHLYAAALNMKWVSGGGALNSSGNVWSSSIEGSEDTDYGWVVSTTGKTAQLVPRSSAARVLCAIGSN